MSTAITLPSGPANSARIVKEDPTLIFAASGTAVAKFTVVTSGRRMNKTTGEWEDVDTTFYRCVAFGQLAENIAEYLERGTAVVLSGVLYQEDYTRKDGTPGMSIAVRVNSLGEDLRWKKPKEAPQDHGFEDDTPPF